MKNNNNVSATSTENILKTSNKDPNWCSNSICLYPWDIIVGIQIISYIVTNSYILEIRWYIYITNLDINYKTIFLIELHVYNLNI